MTRNFEVREKNGGRGGGQTILTGDSLEELVEKLNEKSGSESLRVEMDDEGGWF